MQNYVCIFILLTKKKVEKKGTSGWTYLGHSQPMTREAHGGARESLAPFSTGDTQERHVSRI